MVKFLYHLTRELRPRQWLKNLAVFAAIIFTGQLFQQDLFLVSLWAFLVFCLLSSASYLINDVVDVPRDKLHPVKKFRPIAAGVISPRLALSLAGGGILVGLLGAKTLDGPFLFVAVLFLVLNLAYSLILKKLALIDILTVAVGYILRVYAGEAATGFHLSVWLMLAVVSLSLFLAVGKRRSELAILAAYDLGLQSKIRASLSHYSEKLLDIYLSMFANSTWITYAFYTFLERPQAPGKKITEALWFPASLAERKWLMVTVPFVIYGLMRYTQLIYEGQKGESPERVLLSDRPLLLTVILWILTVVGIIYFII